jgi:hypothetical protein
MRRPLRVRRCHRLQPLGFDLCGGGGLAGRGRICPIFGGGGADGAGRDRRGLCNLPLGIGVCAGCRGRALRGDRIKGDAAEVRGTGNGRCAFDYPLAFKGDASVGLILSLAERGALCCLAFANTTEGGAHLLPNGVHALDMVAAALGLQGFLCRRLAVHLADQAGVDA